MSPHEEKVELFRALEVKEVEARAQHILLDTTSSSYSYPPGGHGSGGSY